MNKDINDIWQKLASIQAKDDIDALRKVLDPNDVKGVKNSYLDHYFKYYLHKYLDPGADDVILEVGCGIGRLSEYISPFAGSVYGIDLVDKFIDSCNANIHKNKNTFYLHMSDRDKLKDIMINKMYTVGVLMFFIDNADLVKALRGYRDVLPNLKSAVLVEQVKRRSQTAQRDREIYCRYRTIEEYRELFESAGFTVKNYHILGERYNGCIYRVIHLLCNVLPRTLARYSDTFFHIDKYLLSYKTNRTKFINNKRPTDVVFQLEAD